MMEGVNQCIFCTERRMAGQVVTNAAEKQDMGAKERQSVPVLNQTNEKGSRNHQVKYSGSVFLKV